MRKFIRNNSAASAIEFALIAPVFLLLLMGMIAYGIYFGAAHSVQEIASDAARTAVAGLNSTERQQLAQDFIDKNAGNYSFVDGKKLTVKVGDNVKNPNQFNVEVSYDATQLPIWNMFPDVIMPSSTIVKTTAIRIGGI